MTRPGWAPPVCLWREPGFEVFGLSAVTGSEPGRKNDLVLGVSGGGGGGGGRRRPESPQRVIYFPGDVQNYRELMARHAENARWQQWSLEDTAALLLRRFPSSHVWIVKASRMHLHKFSCYDNFVESDLFGAPKHSPDYGALGHLRALLSNASKQSRSLLCPGRTDRRVSTAPAQPGANTSAQTPNGIAAPSGTDTGRAREKGGDAPLRTILIGFSKGCVVLNQLLHELSEAQKDEELAAFIQTISQVYWLDGGHAGGSNTWVTSPEVLQELARTGIPVQTHVTPYQVRDSMRAWIGKEHEKFVRLLRELGANVTDQLHFENQPPSLKNHFQVLKMF